MMIPQDKQQHAWVSFGLVWLFWLLVNVIIIWKQTTRYPPFVRPRLPWRIMFLVFGLGAAKEAADAISIVEVQWPWCNPTCQADGWDMIANLVGIVVGGISIVVVQLLLLLLLARMMVMINNNNNNDDDDKVDDDKGGDKGDEDDEGSSL